MSRLLSITLFCCFAFISVLPGKAEAENPAPETADVVAYFDDNAITRDMLIDFMASSRDVPREAITAELLEKNGYENLVQLIDYRILALAAEEEGISVNEDAVIRRLSARVSRLGEEKTTVLHREMTERGEVFEQYLIRRAADPVQRMICAAQAYADLLLPSLEKYDVEQTSFFYQENLGMFVRPADPPELRRGFIFTLRGNDADKEKWAEQAKSAIQNFEQSMQPLEFFQEYIGSCGFQVSEYPVAYSAKDTTEYGRMMYELLDEAEPYVFIGPFQTSDRIWFVYRLPQLPQKVLEYDKEAVHFRIAEFLRRREQEQKVLEVLTEGYHRYHVRILLAAPEKDDGSIHEENDKKLLPENAFQSVYI